MKGAHRLIIKNDFVKYDFTVKRNITIIQGNSATGKTTLVEMVRDFYDRGSDSGVDIQCDKDCAVIEGRNWQTLLASMYDSIIFLDEGNDFITSTEFARAVETSDNYYVIVTREGLPNLPYSVDEIYGIRTSGKYGGLKPIYNELYHIYGNNVQEDIHPRTIVTEDSNSGFEFFSNIVKSHNKKVISAEGKSNIYRILKELPDENILVIADGAAFGSEIGRVMAIIKDKKAAFIYLPESFEWLILKSGKIDGNKIKDILSHPEDFIESKDYVSWERYFTALLIEETKDTFMHYQKKKLNAVYLDDNMKQSILNVMEKISLED